MTPGAPSGPGNIASIADHDSIIDRVCIDAGIVGRAMDAGSPGHDEASAFLTHLDLVRTEVFRSGLVDLELCDIVFGRSDADRHDSRRDQILRAWAQSVATTAIHWVSIDDMTDDVEPLMRRFGLDARRALHVATALATESEAFITTDPEYAVVDAELLPLLLDSDSVAAARAIRGALGS